MKPSLSLRVCAPLLAASLVAGCGSLQTSGNFLGIITPYKLEIVQGNVLTKEQLRDLAAQPAVVESPALERHRWSPQEDRKAA